ncbi:zinc finger, CCHC-type containing protein [Tanacetum coccineum]
MDSIMGKNTWVLADVPPGCKPLRCKWIFKRKLKVDVNIEKFKARLVIKGFKQKLGIDYFDTYALVACISNIRLLIAMASIPNLIVHHIGISTPMDASEKLMPNKGHTVSQLEYSRMIGCLMYAMTCTRHDTAFVVVLEGYTNASWISNSEDNSSISGCVFFLGEAAGKEAKWLRNLILEISLWSKLIAHISIRCDSAATLANAYSQMDNRKSRHLGVRHSMIRELITMGLIL